MLYEMSGFEGAADWIKSFAKDVGKEVAEVGKVSLMARIRGTPKARQPSVQGPIIIGPQPYAPPPAFSPAMKYGLIAVGGLLVVGAIIAATRK